MQSQNEFLEDQENELKLQQPSKLRSEKSKTSLDESENRLDEQEAKTSDSFQIVEDLDSLNDQPQRDSLVSIQKSSELTMSNDEKVAELTKNDIKSIEELGLDWHWFFEQLKEWIESAMMQWAKWAILPDWKARADMLRLFATITWRTKPRPVVNITNLFGKVDINDEKNIY